MRMKLLKVVVVLLLSGSGDARPQRTGKAEGSIDVQPSGANPEQRRSSGGPQPVREDSSINTNDTQRHLKDLQHIDQSLRTVATQLLNVTNSEEPTKILDNVIKKPVASQKPIEKNEAAPVKEINVNNGPLVNVGFGRPINSKFSYFETSHPGQAMAITEEELERELSSTRLITAYKNHPTTTGGISTWILLNPPSTTLKTTEIEKKTKQPMETDVRVTNAKPTTLMEKIDTTERVTMPVSTMLIVDESSTTKKPVLTTTKKTTESKLEKIQSTENVESVQSTTLKAPQVTVNNSETKETIASTTKKVHVRTTPKPKTATTKSSVLSKHSVSKPSRPNQHQNKPKPPMRRTTTVKPDIVKNETVSAGKIEKVTFRPIQMITIPKSKVESTEKPMFVTKIKASILMDTQKTTTQSSASSTTSLEATTTPKLTTVGSNLAEVSTKPKPVGTKVNNVLKVQLKKPSDEATTRIEVEPVKANAPTSKVERNEVKEEAEKEAESLDNTRIDLMQFDFNPELTKINVNTEVSSTSASSTPSTTSTSTTKRPRNNSKRKKNKNRRRKPTTSTTMATVSSATSSTMENDLSEESVAETGIQESKIVPETKVASNWTKTKKKPASTPISMQIYNFLSREVMPSFGMMSLVGLGLGLASYFLYPLGGTVTRRNYEVEPKYKYNFDEYGGNYGQSEEEVLSKVLQGMTTDESKYPGSKDHDSNYYRYQSYDGNYDAQPIKKSDQRYSSSSPMYRPENTASVHKYRNTDYRYTQSTSTPSYYDRPKHREYVVGSALPGTANRQFVVGSVPKVYPSYDDNPSALSTTGKLVNSYEPTEENGQVQFDRDMNQSFDFPVGSVQSYGQVQTARPDETYEEVEITPTAVAVEHGPRSLKVKRSLQKPTEVLSTRRRKRDSVIQIIPSKRELEEEEKEEDLSNEILNIIDSAIPEKDYSKEKKNKDREMEDFESQRRKEKEDEKNRLKETAVKIRTLETSTATFVDTSTVSTATKEAIDSSSSSSSSTTENVNSEDVTTSSKTTESTVEWIDATTKKPAEQNGFNLFNFVKRIAEIKFRLGLTLLKHASEGFARYLGHVQKRINGEE